MERGSGAQPYPFEAVRYAAQDDGSLWIEWDDGHQTSIPPDRLRAACPCAQCREERQAAANDRLSDDRSRDDREPAPRPPGSTQLQSVAAVGRYGLAPVWRDGHHTGIYSWDILRALCGCMACRYSTIE